MVKEFTVRFEVEGRFEVTIPDTITDLDQKQDYAIDIFEDEDFGPLEEADCDMISINGNHASLIVVGWCNVVVWLEEECSKKEIKEKALDQFGDEFFGLLENIEGSPLRYSSDEGEYSF